MSGAESSVREARLGFGQLYQAGNVDVVQNELANRMGVAELYQVLELIVEFTILEGNIQGPSRFYLSVWCKSQSFPLLRDDRSRPRQTQSVETRVHAEQCSTFTRMPAQEVTPGRPRPARNSK